MPYELLSPNSNPDDLRQKKCALAIMAKAPRAGKVKTRLSPPLTLEQSAALNICFLRDTAQNIAEVSAAGQAAGLVCYTPVGEEAAFEGLLPNPFQLVPQRGDGFGERLMAAVEDILGVGYGSACLIDSDSPTVPAEAFRQAAVELAKPGDRVVLGPSNDGGYYLIGLKHSHPELFADIHWSTSSVFAETVAAAQARNLEIVTLLLWYDVDDAATLDVLCAELLDGIPPKFTAIHGYTAEHTRSFLQTLRRGGS
ncbi:MAG TPA: TIGR04282 family arsenosugar biosynthesis glycosyltransferase [Edaphobacter sp.]|nr:TIGR04282 family arsenosugar biosynthesis glycosyltransferase [Edaphobacter sp.]